MSKEQSWADYYRNYQPEWTNILLHAEYLLRVLSKRPRRVLEIGSGPATHALFIKQIKPNTAIHLMDLDRSLLRRVRQQHGVHLAGTYQGDVLDRKAVARLPQVDVVISQGLLEHFTDAQVRQIIRNFADRARLMVFSVPADTYHYQDFGDERLRSRKEMAALVSGAGYRSRVKHAFDPGIRTKRQIARELRFSLTRKLWFYCFGSCHLIGEIDYSKQAKGSRAR